MDFQLGRYLSIALGGSGVLIAREDTVCDTLCELKRLEFRFEFNGKAYSVGFNHRIKDHEDKSDIYDIPNPYQYLPYYRMINPGIQTKLSPLEKLKDALVDCYKQAVPYSEMQKIWNFELINRTLDD